MYIYAICSIIVLPFQTTAEINWNSVNSLFFPGKSKNASLKVSHHHHSDPDMVDGVTLLIKTQKKSQTRDCEVLSMRQLLCTKIQGCCKWEIEVNDVLLMKNENFTEKEETFKFKSFFQKEKKTLTKIICPSCIRYLTLYSVSVVIAKEKREIT